MTGQFRFAALFLTTALVACASDNNSGDDGDDGDDTSLPPGATEPKTLDGQDSGDVGDYVSIAVNGADLHIAYVDRESGKLKYIRSTNGTFGTPQVVAPSADEIVQDTAIAVTSNGDVHIVYHDAKAVDLRYVKASGGTFGMPVVLDGASHQSGTGLRLSVAPNGELHVLYFDYQDVAFKLASTSGGSFGAGTPIAEIVGGSGPAIAVDRDGQLHVSQRDELMGLSYSVRSGGSFSAPKYLDMNDVAELSAIGVSSTNQVSIAYTDQANLQLKYVSGTAATFGTPAVIDSVGGVRPQLALDSAGNAHIVHADVVGSKVHYVRVSPSGMASTPQVIDPSIMADSIAAVATDPSGNAHIAYHAFGAMPGRSSLKYVAIAAQPVTP